MTAQEILKLIEEVDTSDTAKLDEIDARVTKWVIYKQFGPIKIGNVEFGEYHPRYHQKMPAFNFTQSRDELKRIRPIWFFPHISRTPSAKYFGDNDNGDFPTPALPTEELAELHAIIQAIEYERNNK